MTDDLAASETGAPSPSGDGAAEPARGREKPLTPYAGLGLAAVAAILFFGGGIAFSGSSPVWSLALLPLLAFLVPALLLARFARAERQVLPSVRVPVRSVLAGAGVMLGASLLALALAGLVGRLAGPTPDETEIWCWVTSFGPWSRILLFAVVPGLCEEVFFRGALLACLKPWGPVPACLASGLLFAAFHGSLLRLLPVAVLGLALAAVVWTTRNLWLAAAGHVLHNLLVLGALSAYGVESEPSATGLVSWAAAGLVLLAVGAALLRNRVR